MFYSGTKGVTSRPSCPTRHWCLFPLRSRRFTVSSMEWNCRITKEREFTFKGIKHEGQFLTLKTTSLARRGGEGQIRPTATRLSFQFKISVLTTSTSYSRRKIIIKVCSFVRCLNIHQLLYFQSLFTHVQL